VEDGEATVGLVKEVAVATEEDNDDVATTEVATDVEDATELLLDEDIILEEAVEDVEGSRVSK
jgi:hypothetical protein